MKKSWSVPLTLLISAVAAVAYAQGQSVVPTRDENVERVFPLDSELEHNQELTEAYRSMVDELEEIRKAQALGNRTQDDGAKSAPMQDPAVRKEPQQALQTPAPKRVFREVPQDRAPASPVQFFAPASSDSSSLTTLLPGSFVKARLVSGVEANTIEPYPVLLQLDHGFTGPNKTSVDLSHCFVIAKAKANLSTERVLMETERLSCVTEDDKPYESKIKGFTAGMDSTFGSTGTFISKQGQVLLAAVLASVAKNAGEAIASAQQVTETVGAENPVSATNVTGSKAAFVAGRSVVDGASMIAEWYLNYAKQLLPSIAVGSGEDVHVVMLESVKVPVINGEYE